MSNQKNIYELQLIDSAIDKLKRQIDELPQKKDLGAIEEKIEKVQQLIDRQALAFDKACREQKRLEGDLAMITEKIKKEEERLYGGSVSNPKELKSIQEEIKALAKKKDDIENALLEAIEQVESLGGELDKFKRAQDNFNDSAAELRGNIAESTSDISSILSKEEQRKPAAVSKIPAEVLDLYDRLRREKNGIAVVMLDKNKCLGCHLELPEKELDQMTDENDIWRCPHCRRILVKA